MYQSTKNWYAFDCPICGNTAGRGAAVHFDYGVVKCWNCGNKQSISDFVMLVTGQGYGFVRDLLNNYAEAPVDFNLLRGIRPERKVSVSLPYGFTSLLDGEGILGKRARATLAARGFNLDLLDAQGFGYCNKHPPEGSNLEDFFGYIIVPFKRQGELYYYLGRDYVGNFLRYKNPDVEALGVGKSELLFNEDALDLEETVWLTEGWACAATMGKEGVAILGNSLSSEQRTKVLRGSCKTVVVALDAGFYRQALKIGAKLLDHKKVYVLDLDQIARPSDDDPDHWLKDPNDLGANAVLELAGETKPLTQRDLFRLA